MRYDRYVHIIMRDDKIMAVRTSASAGRKTMNEMRDNAMPPFNPDQDYGQYMRKCMEEEVKWKLEKWSLA